MQTQDREIRNPRRDALAGARLHGTMQTPFAASMGDLLAKYPLSSPPTNCFQGNERHGSGFQDEEFRVFTTWNFKTLLRFRMTKASERLETKTPPEHGLGRGSKLERSK